MPKSKLDPTFLDACKAQTIEELPSDEAQTIWTMSRMSIRELRGLCGLTQVGFSSAFQIPKRTIESWESGEQAASHRECPPYVRLLIARILWLSGIKP